MQFPSLLRFLTIAATVASFLVLVNCAPVSQDISVESVHTVSLVTGNVAEFHSFDKRGKDKKHKKNKKNNKPKANKPTKHKPAHPKPTNPKPTGSSYTGDGTWYNTGLGSCGIYSKESELIAALNAPQMGYAPNPNKNPNCGRFALVTGPTGKSVRVKITDTCPGCSVDDLDLSPAAFAKISDLGVGRIKITWGWD